MAYNLVTPEKVKEKCNTCLHRITAIRDDEGNIFAMECQFRCMLRPEPMVYPDVDISEPVAPPRPHISVCNNTDRCDRSCDTSAEPPLRVNSGNVTVWKRVVK